MNSASGGPVAGRRPLPTKSGDWKPRHNAYLLARIRIQSERGQRVATAGRYAHIRCDVVLALAIPYPKYRTTTTAKADTTMPRRKGTGDGFPFPAFVLAPQARATGLLHELGV